MHLSLKTTQVRSRLKSLPHPPQQINPHLPRFAVQRGALGVGQFDGHDRHAFVHAAIIAQGAWEDADLVEVQAT